MRYLNEGKKEYKGKYNPWAVCHASTGPKKSAKFERCVQHVKLREKKQVPEDLVIKAFRKRQKAKLQAPSVFPELTEKANRTTLPPHVDRKDDLVKMPKLGGRPTKHLRALKPESGLTGSDSYRPRSAHATLVRSQPRRFIEKMSSLVASWRSTKTGKGRQVVRNLAVSPKRGEQARTKFHIVQAARAEKLKKAA